MLEKVFLIKNWLILFALSKELWYNTSEDGRNTNIISLSFVKLNRPNQKEYARLLSFVLLNLNIKIGKIRPIEKL